MAPHRQWASSDCKSGKADKSGIGNPPLNADVGGTYLRPFHFFLRVPISAPHPRKPDYGFRLCERALGHKALVFFGCSR